MATSIGKSKRHRYIDYLSMQERSMERPSNA
jgi:hypothetical protein